MSNPIKVPIRTNVLILMGVAYFAVLLVFLSLACSDKLTAADAYDVMESPLMALLGGTLAISKDLIPLGTRNDSNDGGESEEESGDDGG